MGMGRYILIWFTIILHLYGSVNSLDANHSMPNSLNINNNNNNTPVMPQSNVSNTEKTDDTVHLGENDLSQVTEKCNQTYQIPINYMDEMNMTGSYPDETEKLPMCFMKCYMENVGALSSDNTIAMEQAMAHFSANEDIIKSCLAEQSEIDSFDACEYAYFLARCIMMATLVDHRNTDK